MSETNSTAPAAESVTPSTESVETESSSAPEADSVEAIQASDPSLTKAEAKKMLKSLKIKFNGKEVEEQLPFEIEDKPEYVDYMRKQLQMSKLAQSKSQEYSTLENEVRQLVQDIKNNPRKILTDPNIGIDLKQFATQIIEEEIERAKKSPEQLEKEQLAAELQALKEERKKEKESRDKAELERLQNQEVERYDMLMEQALSKHTDLPKSPYVVKKIADLMLLGLEQGMDVSPEDVIPLVKAEMQADLKEMFAAMPEDVIEALVGKEKINSLRKRNIAKGKAAAQLPTKVADTGGKPSQPKETPSITMKKFFGV